MLSSSSDTSDDERHLPMAYRTRKRRHSSSSSRTFSDSGDEDRRRRGRRRVQKRRKHRRHEKKDKPMWKEEGEISDGDTSDCSKASRNRSRSRDRLRRRRRRDVGRGRYEEKRTERTWRAEPMEKKYRCKDCGCKFYSVKGLIHHQMNDHSLDAQCHYCLKKFETKDKFRVHHEMHHANEIVKCVFCKSNFEQPLKMDNKRWDDLFSHIYGEILYSRLADYTEDEEKGATESAR